MGWIVRGGGGLSWFGRVRRTWSRDVPPGAEPNRDTVEWDDAALIGRVLAGDREAFEPLVRRYLGPVQGYMLNQAGGQDVWEDLVQETFLTAYERLSTLRNPGRFGPWLLRIARSKLIDYRRGLRRQPEWLGERVPEGPRTVAVSDTDEYAAVLDAIGRLKDRYRTIVYLSLVEEIAPREIADRLSMNESTVRSRLQRGLEQVRARLGRAGIGREDLGR